MITATPVSEALRLPPDLARRVATYAARHGIPMDLAQKCLLAAGLEAEEAAEHALRRADGRAA